MSLIEFKQLQYSVKQKNFNRSEKLILKHLNGEFRSSELSAIIGPSGSGKSSLLNVLSGYVNKNVGGTIRINGEDRKAFIMQEENLHPLLTVYEAMNFAIKFKTGSSYNEKQCQSKIISILRQLGLEGKLTYFSGKLSGGEQKRLSIALELVDDPSILFLDEPTTGLDSSSSTQCVQLLKNLALEGKTVICTIHTPSALLLKKFDHLYAMAYGCCIYQGSSANLVPFLKELHLVCPEAYNPSDFLIEIASNEYGPQNHRLAKKINNGLNEQYRNSNNNNNNDEKTALKVDHPFYHTCNKYTSSFGFQLIQLILRNYLFSTRDKMLLLIRLAVHVVVALLIGFLYFNIGNDASQVINIYRFVSIGVGFLAYSGFYSLMVRYPIDLPITKREYFNRWYRSSSYYLALVVSDVPVIISCSSIYIFLIYVLTNQPMESFRVINFLLIAVLTSFTAQSFGLLVGSMFDLTTGLSVAALLMATQVLFGGFFIVSKDISPTLYWIFEATYLKHSLDGAGSLIFGYNRTKLDCDEVYCHFQSSQKFMAILGMEENLPKVFCGILTTLAAVHFTAFCIMRYRLRN